MANIITVKFPENKENRKIIADLSAIPGVQISCGPDRATFEKESMTLHEMAEYLGKNYFTVRRWVVDQKRVPSSRPSGAKEGQLLVLKADVDRILLGKGGEKKACGRRPGRKTREVSAI